MTERGTSELQAAKAEKIVRAFVAASRDDNVAAWSGLDARDVEIHSEGGGKRAGVPQNHSELGARNAALLT